MHNLKNLGGNDVSIFLFRFVLSSNGINFILNKTIAADMHQDVDEQLKPLVRDCSVARWNRPMTFHDHTNWPRAPVFLSIRTRALRLIRGSSQDDAFWQEWRLTIL